MKGYAPDTGERYPPPRQVVSDKYVGCWCVVRKEEALTASPPLTETCHILVRFYFPDSIGVEPRWRLKLAPWCKVLEPRKT